jgi:hypothetical protein
VVRVADGAVVASALIDTVAASLDAAGQARPGTIGRVLDQVRALAEGVRGARANPHPGPLPQAGEGEKQEPSPPRRGRGLGEGGPADRRDHVR